MSVLSGVRIIDLSQFEAGPSATILLAYLGAEVIKVEPPGVGEPGRYTIRERDCEDDSWYFLMLNSNKKSITLDLKSEEGKNVFKDLIRASDVLVENFKLGTMEKLGLDFNNIKDINPRLIYGVVNGYGLTGRYSEYPSYDIIAQAMGGGMSFNGYPDRPPVRVGPSIGDSMGGINLALGITAALFSREKTGKGKLVEVSMQDSVLNLCRTAYQSHYRQGECVKRSGNLFVGMYPWDAYPAEDGFVVIGAIKPRQWEVLCRVIERPDMSEDSKYDSMADRYFLYRDEVFDAIAKWTSKRPKREVMEIFVNNNVPCGMVMDTADILADPHLHERGMVKELTHPQRGQFKQLGCPIKFDQEQIDLLPSPLIGEHNREVYEGLLNYQDEKIQELRATGVI
jgi:formyl-CoA transferase